MSYYLKKGDREIGPMEAENLVALLQAGDCLPSDLVRREEDEDGNTWAPLSALFPDGSWSRQDVEPTLIGSSNPLVVTIRQLLNEEQDEGTAHKLVTALAGKLERGETVRAVSVQKKPLFQLVTEAIVATSERLLIVRDLVFAKNIDAITYAELATINMEKSLLGATVRVETHARRQWAIESLPKESADRVVRWVRARQQQLTAEPVAPIEAADPLESATQDYPLARLKKLKELLELGLISEADYEAKKREILPSL